MSDMKKNISLILALLLLLSGCSRSAAAKMVNTTADLPVVVETTSSTTDNTSETNEHFSGEPQTTEKETSRPDTSAADTSQAESTNSQSVKPQTSVTDSTTVQQTKPGATGSDTTVPETSAPQVTSPESTHPSTTAPSTTYPITSKPATTNKPSATYPSTTAPSTSAPSQTTPSATTKPNSTAPSTTRPQTTAPSTTKPQTTAPTTTKPQTAAPSTTAPDNDPVVPDSGASADILYVNYINVGQGDSIFIKVGDCDILIDGGKSGYGSTVSSYLRSKGVDDIELMINSHPDEDHYGGLVTVLNDFVVEQVWGSSYSKSTSSYLTYKSAVSSEGLSIRTPSVGTVYTFEYLTLTVLYSGSGATNSNDSSLVVMLEYGSVKFLFTGDISSTIESKLVSSGKDLSCDVLKVPHHGSAGSSSKSFLNATGASYGVICVGTNSYGHPTSTALNNLSSAGITVYRTDTNGTVVFSSNGSNLILPGGTVTGGSGSSSSGSGSSTGSSSSTNSDKFIGNKESKVFHLPTCPNLPAVSKRNYLYDYWFIVNCIGYTPCQRCLKNYVP